MLIDLNNYRKGLGLNRDHQVVRLRVQLHVIQNFTEQDHFKRWSTVILMDKTLFLGNLENTLGNNEGPIAMPFNW